MAFDAERYLRDIGDRAHTQADGDLKAIPEEAPTAAAALVAIGALSPSRAETVLDALDLGWDVIFRQLRPGSRASSRVGHISFERLTQARIIPLGDELALPQGHLRLRYLVLEHDRAGLFADFKVGPTPMGLRDWIRVPTGMPSGLPRALLTDASGATFPLEFNGHGNDDRWSGQFFTDTPIASDAGWIEIYGQRVELNRPLPPTSQAIQTIDQEDVAPNYLMRLLALSDPFESQNVKVAADALIAAGAITVTDPVVRAINSAGQNNAQRRRAFPVLRTVDGLPAPWPASRPQHVTGPTGLVVTGVITDEFSGYRIAVLALESTRRDFSVDVEVIRTSTDHSILEDRELAWWARDDRDQHYLGIWNGASRATMSGELRFFPCLDARATRIDLMPSTPTARCVISLPLHWGQSPM